MINNTVLVGRLTKDVEVKYTQGGTAVASFTLAVNRNFKNQNGETEADFINCVIWRKPAETLAKYTHKGMMIGVVGSLQSRSYENQQGQRVYVTEVKCDSFQFLENKKQGQSNGSANAGYAQPNNQMPFGGEQGKMPMTYQMPSEADMPF